MDTPQHLKSQREEDARIADQAAEWLDALESGTASSESFFAWLKQSARHVQEVLLHVAVSDSFANLSPDRRRELLTQLTLDKASRPHTIVELPGGATEHRDAFPRRSPRIWVVTIAASVLAVTIAVAWLLFGAFAPRSYATQIGEQRAIELDDGSIVHLNTQSRVSVRFNKYQREIQLSDGEALFNIKHDAARPLFVRTPEAVIRVIGTQFNVYHRAAGTKVSVLDGRVQISGVSAASNSLPAVHRSHNGALMTSAARASTSVTLAAGEETTVAPSGFIEERKPLEIGRAVAWRQRRLVFQSDSLADIANEFNRYNRRITIAVEGGASKRLFSGTFDADAPETLARALAEIVSFEVERYPDEIVVRSRIEDPEHGEHRAKN